ncbi:hypothetical protein IQ243_08030 [Nostocales cyanobacterium LEGE 11386]|nr:hypothetical protein [Nostocales cyanobacterium LEGE 11386]
MTKLKTSDLHSTEFKWEELSDEDAAYVVGGAAGPAVKIALKVGRVIGLAILRSMESDQGPQSQTVGDVIKDVVNPT